LHLSFSGTLLKQFEDPGVRQTFGETVNIGEFLDRYRRSNIEFVGSGLYHPVYPLSPPADWDAQTEWWLGLGRHLFGRERFDGFWPPEMGFCMEMIPMLKRHGYKYVLVDSIFIKPKREMRWDEISEYLRRFPQTEEVEVHRGAWNTEHHWGGDFTQWTGSLLQKKGWDELRRASEYYWQSKKRFDQQLAALENPDEIRHLITRAYDHLLTAETSCNFYWGSRWVHRSFDDLEQAYYLLDVAKEKMAKAGEPLNR